MLTLLRLSHFAIMTECELQFGPGFTVLTGETGAGKSIIVDAIGLLLGNQASEEWIQHGADDCSVEGHFTLSVIPACLAEFMDGPELLIYRRLSRNRPNLIRINDQSVTLKTLKEIGLSLATIMGQHEHLTLLTPEIQQLFLDYDCGPEFNALLTRYQEAFSTYNTLLTQKNAVEKNRQEAQARVSFLKFQHQDITQHGFQRGEEATLEQQRTAFQHKDKFNQALSGAESQLTQAMEAMTLLKRQTETLSRIDTSLETLHSEVNELEIRVKDAQHTLLPYRSSFDGLAEKSLDEIESRLHRLYKLKNTYHTSTLDDLLDKADALKNEIGHLEGFLDESASDGEFSRLKSQTYELAQSLHDRRRMQAESLSKRIEFLLSDLQLPHAKMRIAVEKRDGEQALTSTGFSTISFLLSTNPGEPPKPLQKVVSGGELSRVMLAIRTIFYEYAPVSTLVYDEVDTGIGGLTAVKVGEFLKKNAAKAQVFCVTHLAQIAKFADTHLKVTKQTEPDITITSIQVLTSEEIPKELERMVGGEAIKEILLDKR